jgi:hypothetical protein
MDLKPPNNSPNFAQFAIKFVSVKNAKRSNQYTKMRVKTSLHAKTLRE